MANDMELIQLWYSQLIEYDASIKIILLNLCNHLKAFLYVKLGGGKNKIQNYLCSVMTTMSLKSLCRRKKYWKEI